MTDQPQGDGVLDERAFAQLREMVGDDPEFIADFIGTFLRTAPKQVAEIREGMDAGDAARVQMAAHTLKSNSADMGARRLSELARRFEHAGRDGDLAGVKGALGDLEAAFAEARDALEARRGA